jgi:outer membrane lipoprotein-sorting protein
MNSKPILRCLPVFLIGLFVLSSAVAQKDAKAKALLDKTSAMLNQSGGLSASFVININDEIHNIKQSFEGQMFVKREKFYFDTPEQAIYFDGKTQWVYQKAIEEVSILEPQPQDIQSMNPISIFDMYKKDCDYQYKGEKTDGQKRKVQEISLFPKDNKEDIKQVDIQINPMDTMPVFFHIIYKNNSEFRIHISKYQTKLSLPDSQFVFDRKKYPKAEINDLR